MREYLKIGTIAYIKGSTSEVNIIQRRTENNKRHSNINENGNFAEVIWLNEVNKKIENAIIHIDSLEIKV